MRGGEGAGLQESIRVPTPNVTNFKMGGSGRPGAQGECEGREVEKKVKHTGKKVIFYTNQMQ